MVFRTIDGNLTTIFNRVRSINSGFDLTSDRIETIVDEFNDFNSNQNFGDDWRNFINDVSSQNENVANQFRDLATQGASARASIEGVYAAILNGNTRGFGNVKSITSMYNAIGNVSPENQKAFASAVGQTNAQLGNYLTNLNSANASMRGYVGQLVATTAKTIALRAVTIGLNMALTAGILWLANQGIKLISDFVNHIEITRKKVEDLKSTFQSTLDTANSNAKRVEELADRYDKLSDGVNNLGENVSLTNEEYEEYNSLVNEIADMFPTLVQGYTDEGNAIINLKNNVKDLRDAYKEAQQEAYNMLIVGGKDSDGNDILQRWKDLHDTGFWAKMFDFGAPDVNGQLSVNGAITLLNALQNIPFDKFQEISKLVNNMEEDQSISDFDFNGYEDTVARNLDYYKKALGLTGQITEDDYYATNQANSYSVSIETCHPKSDGVFADCTYVSLCELCAMLLKKYKLTVDDLIRHYDVTGKQCPLAWSPTKYQSEAVATARWNRFKQDVQTVMDSGKVTRNNTVDITDASVKGNISKPATPTNTTSILPYKVKVVDRTGLNVRKGAGVNNPIVTTIKYGEVYTIVDEVKVGSAIWGKLKSGAGFINVGEKYVTKIK